MTDTITPVGTAEEFRTTAKVMRDNGQPSDAQYWDDQAARLGAESARDEETLAQALFSGTAGHFVTGSTWEVAGDHSRNAFRAAARAALDFLAADGRLLPEGGTDLLPCDRCNGSGSEPAASVPGSGPDGGWGEGMPGWMITVAEPSGLWQHKNGQMCVRTPDRSRSYIVGEFTSTGLFECHSEEDEVPDGFTPLARSVEADSGPDGTPEKPWKTAADVPEGVAYTNHEDPTARHGHWVNRDGGCFYVSISGRENPSTSSDRWMSNVAPFVHVDGDQR